MRRHPMWRALVAAAALAGTVPVAEAADPPSPKPTAPATLPAQTREAWLRADTPRFTLFGQVPEARLRAIAVRIEGFRSALERLHPGTRASPRETSIFVFKDGASGRRYAPPMAQGRHHLGTTPPYDVPNYVALAAPVDDPPLEILYHAYAHQFLDDNFPHFPLTVTEGLAEVDAGFANAPQGTLLGVPRAEHVSWLKNHAALPLSRQFSLAARDPLLEDATGLATFMAGSWALMHYLVSGSGEKRTGVPPLLDALRRGAPPDAAVLAAFGWSLERLQQEVEGYVRGGRFLPLLLVREEDPSVQVRPMARDEVLAALGELLAHAGAASAGDAEAHLREALRLNPAQAKAHAGLGYLRYSQNRPAEAIPHFESALEIEPDGMSCYLLARSLLAVNATGTAGAPNPAPAAGGTPPWLARARALLARAILLRPGFAAPYVVLGATHIQPDGDVAAGIDLLQKARAMLPARMDIAGNLVYLLLRKGDLPQAQTLVDRVLANGGDPQALAAGRQALATYREHLKAKQSIAAGRLTPAEEARAKRWHAALAQRLRDALAETDDPEKRERIEHQLRMLEESSGPNAAEIYNEAIDRANRRDYAGAIGLLEDLLPRVGDAEMADQIKKMLERLRQDAARLQPGAAGTTTNP